jgi:hypothetical protein
MANNVFLRKSRGAGSVLVPLGGEYTHIVFRHPNGDEIEVSWSRSGSSSGFALLVSSMDGQLAVVPEAGNLVRIYPHESSHQRQDAAKERERVLGLEARAQGESVKKGVKVFSHRWLAKQQYPVPDGCARCGFLLEEHHQPSGEES